jgi:hypothetical protein
VSGDDDDDDVNSVDDDNDDDGDDDGYNRTRSPVKGDPRPLSRARQVFDIEQGVCVLCAFDAHHFYQQVRTSVSF